MNLADKTIAITGAAQGLGQTMAINLGQLGASVIGIDLTDEKLAQTASICAEHDIQFHGYGCNMSDEESVINLVGKLKEMNVTLDGFVNNAGIVRDALLIKAKNGQIDKKMSLADWQSVIDVNLTGVFLGTREAAAMMIEQDNHGVIVNISSVSRHGNMGQTNYTAAKAGVAAMTVTWAKELSRYGIRVGAVAPGYIATDLTKAMKPEALQKMQEQIPLKRLGEPHEIAHAVQYILENDYFTGRIIDCDGGLRV